MVVFAKCAGIVIAFLPFNDSDIPVGISDDLPWGGYGFFLELQMYKT